jgi:FkbM family methyltransferase
MRHKLRRLVLNAINNTPLEGFARKIYSAFSQDKGTQYDRETRKVMQKALTGTSNCIDIGAYRGEILREMLAVCPGGNVFAIEPIPENYEYLCRHYHQATLFNLALSDTTGTATFYKVTGRPARSGLKKQKLPDPNEIVDEISVEVATLDTIIPTDQKIDFIKIDVEGAELQVMRGGAGLIKRDKPIVVFEFGADFANSFDTSAEDVYDFLTMDCELEVSVMNRWLRLEKSFSKTEFIEQVDSGADFYFMAYPG